MTGEQYGESFTKINPSSFVPVLEDGYLRLIESSAILKCLAEISSSASYPTDPQAKAQVNEVMNCFNTNFYRTFGYGLVYPQVLDHVKFRMKGLINYWSPRQGPGGAVFQNLERPLIGTGLALALRRDDDDRRLSRIRDLFSRGSDRLHFQRLSQCCLLVRTQQGIAQLAIANAGVYEWAKFVQGPK